MSAPSATAKLTMRRRDSRLTLRHNPIGLVCSASVWRSAGYLGSSLIVGSVLFTAGLATAIIAAVLGSTVVAVPLLIGAAEVIRGCAAAQRAMLRQVFTEPVAANYPEPRGEGLWQLARARWSSATTWRDLACVVGLWPVLLTPAVAVLAIWATLGAGITLPLWYSRVPTLCMGDCGSVTGHGLLIGYYPNGVHGPGHDGLYVHTLPAALVAAAVFAVAFLLFNYVLVATARLHAQLARTVLRTPADPLAPAKAVLAGPSPLGPLVGTPDDRLLR
jgi:hypothetical protein